MDSIGKEAQKFYDEFFAESDAPKITLGLQLSRNATYPPQIGRQTNLTPPIIELVIQIGGKNDLSSPGIPQRSQAHSACIVGSIRSVTGQPSPIDLKLLVLDDLLVSLDMSNRMRVVDILMSDTFKDYQKIM